VLEATETEPEGTDQDLIVKLEEMVERGMRAMVSAGCAGARQRARRRARHIGAAGTGAATASRRSIAGMSWSARSARPQPRSLRKPAPAARPAPKPKQDAAPPTEAKAAAKKTPADTEASESSIANQSIRVNVTRWNI